MTSLGSMIVNKISASRGLITTTAGSSSSPYNPGRIKDSNNACRL